MGKKRLVRLKKLPERHEDTKVFTKDGTHTTLLCETSCSFVTLWQKNAKTDN